MTSAPLRTLTIGRAKMDAGEEATDADATAFCKTAASTRSKLLAATETILPFVGEVVVAIVVATARCTRVATITQSAGL